MKIDGICCSVDGRRIGVGRATVVRLAAQGAKVVMADLRNSSGETVAAEIGGKVRFVPADVTNTEQMNAAFDSAAQFGPLRAVVAPERAVRSASSIKTASQARSSNTKRSFVSI